MSWLLVLFAGWCSCMFLLLSSPLWPFGFLLKKLMRASVLRTWFVHSSWSTRIWISRWLPAGKLLAMMPLLDFERVPDRRRFVTGQWVMQAIIVTTVPDLACSGIVFGNLLFRFEWFERGQASGSFNANLFAFRFNSQLFDLVNKSLNHWTLLSGAWWWSDYVGSCWIMTLDTVWYPNTENSPLI